MTTFSISKTIKEYPANHPYEKMKRAILGVKYDLSLVFVGQARATTLNRTYRDKTYSPNVLSFPLTDKAGEIVICPQVAKGEAAKFGLTVNGYIAYLFIHGLLHLKGLDHSDIMDKMERKYLKAFNIR